MIDPAKTLLAARRLELVMTVGLVLLSALALVGAGLSLTAPDRIGESLALQGGYGGAPLAPWQNWALIGVMAVHLALWVALFALARQLFGRLAQGLPAEAASSARHVAALLWVMLFWGIASQALASVAATWGYPEGERAVSIALGTPQVSVAFSALVASFMARAFALGADLWQDHQEVI
ncbi:MAG: hypothetical protein RIG84_04530 [Roseovarius sp.]